VEIDPRRLRFLLAVGRTGGVLAAADELGVSPSAVSQQLTRLEQEVGRDLVERTPRGAVLTAAGHALAETAEEVERALEDARARLSGEDSDPVGSVHLGAFQTFLVTVLLPHLPQWRSRFGRVHLDIVESDRDTLLRLLRSNELDLAVIELDAGEPTRALPRGVRETPLLDEPWKLVVPTGTVIGGAVGDVVDLSRLSLPWLGAETSAASWQAVRRVRRSLGVRTPPVHTFANFQSAVALVAAGEGFTLLPSLALHLQHLEGVDVLDVPGLGTRRIVLRQRDTGDVEAVEAVATLIRESAAGLSQDLLSAGRGTPG
jgi:molybdate transport repressor ModE-like protein